MQFFNRDKFIFYYSIIKGKIKITCNHLTGELGPLHNTTWPIHFQSAYLGWSRAHISGSQDPWELLDTAFCDANHSCRVPLRVKGPAQLGRSRVSVRLSFCSWTVSYVYSILFCTLKFDEIRMFLYCFCYLQGN
jgi:hypothetical protein